MDYELGPWAREVDEQLERWAAEDFAGRLFAGDPGLWVEVPVPELSDRLGWLRLPRQMASRTGEAAAFATAVRADGLRRVMLLGMGGSSLAPEVLSRAFEGAPGLPLEVLDSTHPAAVTAAEGRAPLAETLFLVASKSGTTIETTSLFDYFWSRVESASEKPGRQFAAITDPGTPLARLAGELGLRALFPAPPEVGGRFSALSVFGLVPAALVGIDLDELLGRAARVEAAAGRGEAEAGLRLGAALGRLAAAGRDKLTLLAAGRLSRLPEWIEQLVAESTGKRGRGILPLAGEAPAEGGAWSDDRVFVRFALDGEEDPGAEGFLADRRREGHPVLVRRLAGPLDLGAELYRWEIATAALGALLRVNPFDQPDVESAKRAAGRALEAPRPRSESTVPAADAGELQRALGAWLGDARRGDYVAIQAFLAPSAAVEEALRRLQDLLRRRTGLAAAAAFGPRYLHSTGQLHKGGPDRGLFLQLVDRPAADLEIPGRGYGFGRLLAAQAQGDAEALRAAGRRLLAVDLGVDPAGGLGALEAALGGEA